MNQQTAVKTIEYEKSTDKVVFGFWVYILTDCVLFASLFATYAVLQANTFGGPSAKTLFNLPFVLTETLILLLSSFTIGLGMLFSKANNLKKVLSLLVISFVLGLCFLTLEFTEFNGLIREGNSFQRSGFLSAFFTLVGTHGLHITVGLVWMASMMFKVFKQGLTPGNLRKLTCLSIFWHFLDLVWIFIFSIVYLWTVL